MPNTFEKTQIFQTLLDQQITQEATSNFLEANAGQVIYNGGDTVKIPTITTDGLSDYDRQTGYPSGAVTLSYETMKMTQDRAQSFNIDAMDVNETNYMVNVANIMGVFQREKVIPEIDLYRWNQIFLATDDAKHSTAKSLTKDIILDELQADITAVEDKAGTRNGLVIVMNINTASLLNSALDKKLDPVTFTSGEIHTEVKGLDGIPIIKVSSTRMNTKVTKDASTKALKAAGAAINWLIFPQFAPIAVSKTDTVRIFSPNGEAGYPAYQGANAWHVDYRKFHDIWIPKNRLDAFYAHVDPAA